MMEAQPENTNHMENWNICSSKLNPLFTQMGDDLYGTPGQWEIYRCTNSECALAVVHPHPTQEELNAAYSTYFTHDNVVDPEGLVSKLWNDLRYEYLARKYNYHRANKSNFLAQFLSYMILLFPGRKSDIEASVYFLPSPVTSNTENSTSHNNRLLEIGCGSGKLLHRMHHLGWNVTGIDIDETAIQPVKEMGIDLRAGELDEQGFKNSQFDVIVMKHVIEHLSDPALVLKKCRDLLKPEGKLVLFTPNINSRGFHKWGKYWRGLDVPRHLTIYNAKSLSRSVEKLGFEVLNCRTTGRTRSSEVKSRRIYRKLTNKKPIPKFVNILFSEITEIYECLMVKHKKEAGDELHLVAMVKKPD